MRSGPAVLLLLAARVAMTMRATRRQRLATSVIEENA
jgi:hypothetical protein